MSGRTQQLVCPYIVSGLSVAAIRKTFFPASALQNIKQTIALKCLYGQIVFFGFLYL